MAAKLSSHPCFFTVFVAILLTSTSIQISEASLYSVPTVYQRIYKEVGNINACFRLLNSTHQIGCSASPSNVSGVLWHIESQENLTDLLDNHPYDPYIVILEPHLFTAENVRSLKNSDHINGIIMYYNKSGIIPPEVAFFSPAKTCPNSNLDISDCRDWNVNGSQLTFDDFEDFAIFTVSSEESYQDIVQCFEDHNRNTDGSYGGYPLCSAELQADMQAVISTAECYLRAKMATTLGVPNCQPLGDDNVWGSLFELEENQDIVIVATKLDSSALIPDLAFGGNNEAAGIVTQLAIAEALGKLKRDGSLIRLNKQIVFVFFHGESFDYIGSSRMVYDMIRGNFPYSTDSNKQQPPLLNITNISSILELSQIGVQDNRLLDKPLFYLHANDKMSSLFKTLLDSNESVSFSDSTVTAGQLPPASAQMFLRENDSIPVVIVTDYNQQYSNKFYGSRYDTIDNLLDGEDITTIATELADLATSLAQTLLDISDPIYRNQTDPPLPVADSNTVSKLLECLLVRTNCSLLQTVLDPDWVKTLSNVPVGRYVTVNTVDNPETQHVFNLLAYFTGIQNETFTTCSQCDDAQSDSNQVYTYTTMTGLNYDSSSRIKNCTCFKSYTHRHEATSPAFALKDYTSDRYSTWTESNWGGIGMRLYLVTFPLFESGIFVAGLTITIISMAITIQCSRKSRKIFAVTANNIIVNQS